MGGKSIRGRHLFYRCDESEALVGNLKKAGLPGVDIKHNGYVVGAGSLHESGKFYQVIKDIQPAPMMEYI